MKISIDPGMEWQQIAHEAWRLQRDYFWTEDMSQIDWNRVWERYAPLVERVGTRGELSDLMWEMQGELGTSHAYEMGGDYRSEPSYPQGFLGANLTYDAGADAYAISPHRRSARRARRGPAVPSSRRASTSRKATNCGPSTARR